MKTIHASRLIVPALLASLALAGFPGCQNKPASPSLNQGAAAADSIHDAAESISALRRQIGLTTAALRNLTDRPGDIAVHYKTVLDQIATLQADAQKISRSADKMRADGDRYLAEWARQIAAIQDPGLRDAAFARRGETATKLQEIFASYQTVKAAYLPYERSLVDIQKVVGSDLTPKGVETVKPYVAKATTDSAPLIAALDKLTAQFREIGVALTPNTPTPAAPAK
jgi:hypothetical protein